MPELEPRVQVMPEAAPTLGALPRSPQLRVAAVLAAYNRRAQTLACLQSLAAQLLPPGVRLDVYLLDDASPDGTAAAVRAAFPGVQVLEGTGGLYWNGGMRVAFGAALDVGYDFYWWLNDDTYLYPNTLCTLLATHGEVRAAVGMDAIVVGSTRDPATGRTSYGGRVRTNRWQPLHYRMVDPTDAAQPCDTMNGNCVLIPAAVAVRVGNLDPAYVQGAGDWDYGYRARALGFPVYVAPGYTGDCSNHAGSQSDTVSHWRRTVGPKGLPPRAWFVYTRRYAGPFWLAYWLRPYVVALLKDMFSLRGAQRGASSL